MRRDPARRVTTCVVAHSRGGDGHPSLENVENGKSETKVDVSLGALQGGEAGPFAVNVHK